MAIEKQGGGDVLIGVDLGTGGVRAMAVDISGEVVASSAVSLEGATVADEGGIHEQAPQFWWEATCQGLQALMGKLASAGIRTENLKGLAVDGTSGTVVFLNGAGEPLRPGIMYNDARSGEEAEGLNELAANFCEKLGYRFAASFALAKIDWVRRNEPVIFEKTVRFLHQGDYIEGRLCGEFGLSDYSNALKTGYDLVAEEWPDWIGHLSGVRERLPQVVAPGTQVGQVGGTAAGQTGLPEGLPVVAGATDGTAACVASGVRRPGDYNTTLGTTLVFKGVSEKLGRHPEGLVYSHKLPGGFWLPGAASNTGGEWIEAAFLGADLSKMDAVALGRLPSACVAYPLARRGERFPFLSEGAEGFCIPEPEDEMERFAACLQGTAFVERMGYEVIDEVAGTSGGEVFSTGGGSRSDVWMQCRADVTGRIVHRPTVPESAFGSAVLAAAGTVYGDVWTGVENMVRIERTFVPDGSRVARCEELYGRFREEIGQWGWE
jgi:D-ribulokinase